MTDNKVILHEHIVSKKYNMTAQNKSMENILSISSLHEFSDTIHNPTEEGEFGYDWYFIKQTPNLNGQAGYNKHWAGTRKKVNGGSWYVGQGMVALYYVQSYEMETKVKKTNENKDYINYIDTIEFEPTAINNITEYSESFGFNIGGAVGIEGGKDSGGGSGKGSGSLNWGINYSETETVQVMDCSCRGYTGSYDNMSCVKWVYTFNPPSGKYQKINGPAELAVSTFKPVNMWVWRIPTKYRNLFKQIETSLKVTNESIITRYSGSQPAKRIPSAPDTKKETIDLPLPPLVSVDTNYIKFEKEGGTKDISIMSEYKTFSFSIVDSNGKECDWVSVEHINAHTEESKLLITVSELEETKNRNCKIKIIGNNENSRLAYQSGDNDLQSVELSIFQLSKSAE